MSRILAFSALRQRQAIAHVAIMRTDGAGSADPQTISALATAGEMAVASTFPSGDLRDNSLASSVLTRALLARWVGGRMQDWTVSPDARGAPQATHPTILDTVHVSRSRTSGIVAAGVCTTKSIGVDIEHGASADCDRGVASSLFSGPERNHLRSLPADGEADGFFRIWTLKEAYIKARKLGFALPLDSFSLIPDGRITSFRAPPDDTVRDWRFASVAVTADHFLAIAVRARKVRFELSEAVVEEGVLRFQPCT